MRCIGAVDIGGSKIAVGIVRDDGTLLARDECRTEPELGFGRAMDRIERMLRLLAPGAGALEGIGVGCPGPLDPLSGRLQNVGTLPGWQGESLRVELQRRFAVDVAVENDADAAALAESVWGSGAQCAKFLYVTVSTGIGGGIVLDGRLYRGMNGAHPELGHQVLDAGGPLCYCGARGCWESLASGLAMTAWMKQQTADGLEIAASEICARAARGEALARRAVERQGYHLGLGLANLVTLFAPEKIALGGGVMKSGHLFLPEARRVVKALCTQVPAASTMIDCASLGGEVGLLGAAQCWLQRFGGGAEGAAKGMR